ncbi:hypothetical protein I503_05538 [Candida albicans SC5314]|uniref:Uncharacterized protein n=1 Tax=Candida albicans (strain WO-1) TaxID=294748 RepID=C4YNK7_CANAW|nr:conserved hypothetical protein [Candida albicans WO-1]KGQ81460.1 hypothetical protein MEO_05441 [Candida albicans P94015]KGT64692.1 hypothetical protein MEK_05474 [Candida albicans 12C]KHC71093.1 hypothetical protein W5Q_05575 [Candida albicans SC5314]KHC79703.1 hypothetical protein I503_05538 [Candida albicans SC5314]
MNSVIFAPHFMSNTLVSIITNLYYQCNPSNSIPISYSNIRSFTRYSNVTSLIMGSLVDNSSIQRDYWESVIMVVMGDVAGVDRMQGNKRWQTKEKCEFIVVLIFCHTILLQNKSCVIKKKEITTMSFRLKTDQ